VESLFKQFEKAGDRAVKTKRQLADQMIKELTTHAEAVADTIAALTAGRQQLIIDLAALDFIDCHVIGVLLGARATARRAGGRCSAGRTARAGAASADPAWRARSPRQRGRRRGQRRQHRNDCARRAGEP
jgi:hypothetical protein